MTSGMPLFLELSLGRARVGQGVTKSFLLSLPPTPCHASFPPMASSCLPPLPFLHTPRPMPLQHFVLFCHNLGLRTACVASKNPKVDPVEDRGGGPPRPFHSHSCASVSFSVNRACCKDSGWCGWVLRPGLTDGKCPAGVTCCNYDYYFTCSRGRPYSSSSLSQEPIPERVRARDSEGVILSKLCLNFTITKLQVSG